MCQTARRFVFVGRKGKKNEVVGQIDPTGRKVDAAALNGMLGGAAKEVYDQVFGFSLRELAEADESLKRANLTEALYGGGLGGLAHFQRIQAELQSEADVLFTSRGRSKQLIHKLLSNIKDQSKELKAQTVKPRDFEQLTREAKEAHATVELLRQQLESMRARKAHLDRLADAIGPWLRSRDAERELAELQIPDDFPIDGGEQFTRLKVRRTELAEELEGVERELAEESEQLAALQLAPDLLANEAVIRELEQQITQVVGYRRDLPLRQQDSNSIKSRVRAQLKSFSPDWDDRHLERFRTTLAQRETVDRLEAELEELLRRKSTAAAERRTVENDLRTLQEQLSSSDTDDLVDSLTSILELAPEYQQQVERLGEVRQQSSTIENDIEVFLLKLSSPLGTKIKVDDMSPLPMSATVAEFRERLDRSGHDVTEAERSVLAIRQDCDQKQEQLALCDASTAVPDRDQLRASRENRDEGWRLIREQFLDQKAPKRCRGGGWLQLDKVSDVEIAKSLASSYEASVRAADDLADERQDKAEEAATRDQLKYEIGRLEKRLTAAEQNLELHLQQHQQVLNQWESLWSECLLRRFHRVQCSTG